MPQPKGKPLSKSHPNKNTYVDFSKIKSYPWEKHTNELVSAYKWFIKFRDIPYDHDVDRNLKVLMELYEKESSKLGKNKDAVYKKFRMWSSKYRWTWRSNAYDKFQAHEEAVSDLQRRRQEREKWNDRKEKFADETWDHIKQLRYKAKEIINAPLFEDEITEETEKTNNGKTIINKTIIRKPLKGVKLSDATKIIEVTDKLGRLLFNLSTEILDINMPHQSLVALARERMKESIEEFPDIEIESRAYAIATRYKVKASELLDPTQYNPGDEIIHELNQLKPKALLESGDG